MEDGQRIDTIGIADRNGANDHAKLGKEPGHGAQTVKICDEPVFEGTDFEHHRDVYSDALTMRLVADELSERRCKRSWAFLAILEVKKDHGEVDAPLCQRLAGFRGGSGNARRQRFRLNLAPHDRWEQLVLCPDSGE
jgi:hypothetical protein